MRRSSFVSRVLMTVLVLTAACSTDSTQGGAQLSLVIGNTDVRSVQYDIVCEGGATFSDEFEVVDDRDPPVWETFVGLPAGENCVITLTAFNDAGNPICTGSTSVDIIEGQTVKADITLQCPTTGEIGTGNVNIDGRFEDVLVDICPIIHILNAIPRVMTEPPGESSLRIQSSDPDGGAVATVLSSTSGVIADPNASSTMFSCTQAGLVEVTATAASGDPNCEQRVTITLTCPDTGNACDGVDCDDGNECTDDGCANGNCSNVNAPDGTACSIGECVNGSCQAIVDPCDGVVCDDGNECTAGQCTDGNCSYTDLADGTPCDGGTCQGGACEPSDLCADPCPPTGNECTVNLCDPADGSCNLVNLQASTPCDGGNGTCNGLGECVPPANVCDGFECPVDPDSCVQTSACVDQGGVPTCVDLAKPANASCLFGVHAGSCFGDCGPLSNNPADCVCGALSGCCEPTGECQVPVCTDLAPPNECGTPQNVVDGTICDSGNGSCVAGACVPNQGGLCDDAATRCDDNNDCTDDDCDAVTGECLHTPAATLTECTDPVGWTGACLSSLCITDNPCFAATTEGGRCDAQDVCLINQCDAGTPDAPGTGACSTSVNVGATCGLLGDGVCLDNGTCSVSGLPL